MLDLTVQLERGLRSLGIAATEDQQQQLLLLVEQLLKWNKAYNLTSISDAQDALKLHILDSLAVLPFITQDDLIDVGTGPGFPGLPLAIMLPNTKFTLLDSNGKKIRFIVQMKHLLKLDNIEAVHARVEQHSKQQYSAILSRAFASIEDMVGLTKHLLKPGGCWLAMKAQYQQQEVDFAGLNIQQTDFHELIVPGLNAKRCLVELKTIDQ